MQRRDGWGMYEVSMESCWLIFFFSSRRRHTRCSRDWSSDVCSSDLLLLSHGRALILYGKRGSQEGAACLSKLPQRFRVSRPLESLPQEKGASARRQPGRDRKSVV